MPVAAPDSDSAPRPVRKTAPAFAAPAPVKIAGTAAGAAPAPGSAGRIEGQPVALHAQRTGDIDRFGVALAAGDGGQRQPGGEHRQYHDAEQRFGGLPVTERLTSNQGSFSQVGRVASFIRKQNYNFATKMHRDLYQVVNKTGTIVVV